MQRNGVSRLSNSKRQTRIFTPGSEQWAGSEPWRSKARITSRRPRASLTPPAFVPSALQNPIQTARAIPLSELARKLDVDAARLLPAIEHGYIRLICSDPPTVYEPPPAAVEWLRMMYQPIAMRPLIPIDMVASIEHFRPHDIRNLCLGYDVPISYDPVFGEILSLSAFYKLHEHLHRYREPSRFDRQMLLVMFLHAADPDHYRKVVRPPEFSRKLENEIQRVSKLKEPARTDAALRLWDALESAKKVAECIAASRGDEVEDFKGTEKLARIVCSDAEKPPESGSPATALM